jgi:NADPH-dependent 2,4-dienoyl-CoA reductase/sulfur reductase-like enzyme
MLADVEIAIIGSGPGGLAAASEAVGISRSVALFDTYPLPGGQYYRQIPGEFSSIHSKDVEEVSLLSRLDSKGLQLYQDAVVWGINYDVDEEYFLLSISGPDGVPRRVTSQKVILSTGAYDRPMPFPGWTLPGVMTAGAAQIMLKNQRVLPGKHVLLAGTGPLQWSLAYLLISAGAEVAAIVDANPFPWKILGHPGVFWGQWQRLREGIEFSFSRIKAGVRLFWGHTILRAEGSQQVESAVIGPVGGGRLQSITVDAICTGYGFSPSAQLAVISGAGCRYTAELGGFVPIRNDALETTLPGLFSIGDGSGTGGKDVAILEGRLASLNALRQLGYSVSDAELKSIHRHLLRQRHFSSFLLGLFPYPLSLLDRLPEDTVVCRCEEITVGDIRQVLDAGVIDMDNIKALTRIGMGRCQGRMCAAALNHLVARHTGRPYENVGMLRPRPPAIAVPLGTLVEQEEESHAG